MLLFIEGIRRVQVADENLESGPCEPLSGFPSANISSP